MALTPAQLLALKNDIASDPVLSALPNTADDAFAIAAVYNADASPDFYVWKTRLGKHEVTDLTAPGGTTFDWAGPGGYIARSVAEKDAWREMWNSTLSCNPSLPNVRAAFADIFSGTGSGATNNRAHILALGRRLARRIEALYATGTGTTAAPALMGYEGTISYNDVLQARA